MTLGTEKRKDREIFRRDKKDAPRCLAVIVWAMRREKVLGKAVNSPALRRPE